MIVKNEKAIKKSRGSAAAVPALFSENIYGLKSFNAESCGIYRHVKFACINLSYAKSA